MYTYYPLLCSPLGISEFACIFPPLDLPSLVKRPQDVSGFSNHQSRGNWSIGIAIKRVSCSTIPFDPDMTDRHLHRTSWVRLTGPNDISLQPNDSLDHHLFGVQRAPERGFPSVPFLSSNNGQMHEKELTRM